MSRRAAAVLLCALAPLTVAATDPPGDAVPCLGTHAPGDPPDLVGAAGWIGEEGSIAVWRLTFAEPIQVPDPSDPPFRVDIVVRDPRVPTVSIGDYRRFNRLVRFDASGADAQVELLFVPEGGHTLFDPPDIHGDTMTIQMPGRLLLGTDLFGRVDLERLRWSVVVRDGGRCDLLGDGVPSLQLARSAPATPAPITTGHSVDVGSFRGREAAGILIAAMLVLILAAAFVIRRRR